ncbi:MAG: YciI family protein [Gemmatimonadaceae bacterium]
MRFMTLYKGKEGVPPTAEHQAAMGKLIEDMAKEGVLLATDGLLPSSRGARVRISNGKISVTDGPFSEAKEVIGGYAIINVKSKEEAIEYTKRFLQVVGEGESEVREMYEAPAFSADHGSGATAAGKAKRGPAPATR